MIRTLLLSAAVLLIGACATGPSTSSSIEAPDEAKLFGDFLAGTYASNVLDFDARSKYYARAYARAQDDIYIGRRALSFAILDGDIDLARTLAMEILAQDPAEPMARMVVGQRAFSKGDARLAAKYFGPDTTDLTMGNAMDFMQGWSAYGAGDEAAAIATFEGVGGGANFDRLADLQIAIIDGRAGRTEDALKRLAAVDDSGLYSLEATLARARILVRAGQVEEAEDVLTEHLAENGNPEFGPVRAMLADVEAGRALPKLTPRQLAARALTEPSYSFFVRNRALDAAELYLWMAHDLDPDHDKVKLWLGNILEGAERNDKAMELYDTIGDDSPYYVTAQLSRATLHLDRDEDEQGLAILEAVNARYPSVSTREALGRVRLIRENYAEALPIYDALVKSLTAEQLEANTQPLFFRGVIHTELDNFPEAVADFRRVLAIDPENSDALNYLGYSWVDRGENLREAFDMIEKAVELEPQSGAIVDSLGWAHYKLGQYSEARKHLEKASQLSPDSATIIDHLGDTYWKLGRFREAGYQWKRALTLDPTDEEAETIRAKIAGGLDAAPLKDVTP